MKTTTPLKSIRAKCIDCCCGQLSEVRLCTSEDCSLYQYRLGNDPARKGKGGNPHIQELAHKRNNLSS